MTDARWQAEQQDLFRRPERPAWASAFLAADSGPEWDAHAPLREAERLLLENKTEEGLVLLRKVVADHPDSTLATEAQFRIGKAFLDRQDWLNAAAELRCCLRLPGCEALEQARQML